MRRTLALIFALVGWFALFAQFFLMMENRTAPVMETIVRFFSYFTILTNSLVAVYFSFQFFRKNEPRQDGTLTAVTVYITVVGLVYQILLRHLWQPTGLQRIVDELLHTIIPLLVIIFWFLYESKLNNGFAQIPKWLIYPLVYLIFILVRGNVSGFYPYPFVDVGKLGFAKVLTNSFFITLGFILVSFILVASRRTTKLKTDPI